MQDSAPVRMLDRLGQRGHQLCSHPVRHHGAAASEPGRQRDARTVCRSDETARPVLARLVDRHDIGVVQARGRHRLVPEPRAELAREQHLAARNLERQLAPQPRVIRQVHDSEGSPPQLAPDHEPAQLGRMFFQNRGFVSGPKILRRGLRFGGMVPHLPHQLAPRRFDFEVRPERRGNPHAFQRRDRLARGQALVAGRQPQSRVVIPPE